jgi:Icc-related predicted phosphoesterase
VVNNKTVTIDGVNLLFSTLWGNIEPHNELWIKSHVSDFNCIRYEGNDFRPYHFNLLHKQSKNYLLLEFERLQGQKNVVITHHVPTLYDYPEEYRKSKINQAFVVEMDDLITKFQPEAWIYGHSHENTPEFKIGKTLMLTNQLGYVQLGEC